MTAGRNRCHRGAYAVLLAGICALALSACGADGTFLLFVNFGTIRDTATCDGTDGRFPFERSEGLVVIVIVNDDTDIVLANGSPGTCADLRAGLNAEVRGSEESGRVTAQRVTIHSS